MNDTLYRDDSEFFHECSAKKCASNFDGICRQPFMRCERNVDIAFKALKENRELKKFKQNFMNLYKCNYFIKCGCDAPGLSLDTFIEGVLGSIPKDAGVYELKYNAEEIN